MRVAVLGSTGRLGSVLCEHLAPRHQLLALGRAEMDLADGDSIRRALEHLDCEVVLNAAALTSVEACEADARLAMRVNSAAPGKIALWAAERGVRMIHFSTDYVFGGQLPGLRSEGDATGPLSAYGRSKLAGERAVLTHPGHLVLRVSWLYGEGRPSFVDQMMAMATAGEPLAAIADKWSKPTPLAQLASWVESLMATGHSGLLHACPAGEPASWHDVAEAIVSELHACGRIAQPVCVRKQGLADHPAMQATRPRHTAMSSERLACVLGTTLPHWRDALVDYVRRAR
ncbi:MAG TPA: NAD(P)-dependent oxidoreductase [Luteolibacter sp.]|nr:NAD(P)-dependent oxidoreductase [Luteolibacter sp.]